MGKKCCLDDGRNACAYIKTEDPEVPWNPICILHLLRFLADSPKLEFRMMRGVPEPPKIKPEEKHEWARGRMMVGVNVDWVCQKCGLTVYHIYPPSPDAWGGCVGEKVNWEEYK